jgi:hypothetical protein
MNRALVIVAGAWLGGCAMSEAAFARLGATVSAENDRAYEAATAALLHRHQATRIDEAPFVRWVQLPEATRRRCLVLRYGTLRKTEAAATADERVQVEVRAPGEQAPTLVEAALEPTCGFAQGAQRLEVRAGDATRTLSRFDVSLARNPAGRLVAYRVTRTDSLVRRPLVRQSCDHMPRSEPNPFEHDLGPVYAWWVPDEPPQLIEATVEQTGLEARCTDNTY